MKCWVVACEREIYGEVFDIHQQVVTLRYCFLHRPAVKDGRYSTKIARLVGGEAVGMGESPPKH